MTDVKLYVNGVEETTTGSAEAITTAISADVTVGVCAGTGRYFNGLIDDVRIYSRALNENEIESLAGI